VVFILRLAKGEGKKRREALRVNSRLHEATSLTPDLSTAVIGTFRMCQEGGRSVVYGPILFNSAAKWEATLRKEKPGRGGSLGQAGKGKDYPSPLDFGIKKPY